MKWALFLIFMGSLLLAVLAVLPNRAMAPEAPLACAVLEVYYPEDGLLYKLGTVEVCVEDSQLVISGVVWPEETDRGIVRNSR